MQKYIDVGNLIIGLLIGGIVGAISAFSFGILQGKSEAMNEAIKNGVARKCYIDPQNMEIRREVIVWGTDCNLNNKQN